MKNLSNTVTYKVLYNTIAVLICYLTVISSHSNQKYVRIPKD
jgi:hypothetical protein